MISGDPPAAGDDRWRALNDDDALLRLLGRALRDDPPLQEPPPDAVEAAKAIWADVDLEVELAALLLDSAPEEELVGMRGDTAAAELRSLIFEGSAVRIEVELASGSGELLGRLEPPEQVRVDLHTTAGVRSTTTDELGRFRLELPTGGLRIRVCRPSGPDLLTPWISR